MQLSRRQWLGGIAAASALIGKPSRAAVPGAWAQGPGVYRMALGDYQLTALYDGLWRLPIDEAFVHNASKAEVDGALAAAFLPPGILPVSFTALMVNTGCRLILIDTGTAGQIVDSAGALPANLAAAGVRPEAIDTVLISHFHPDHIDGIKTRDGAKVFPNAEIAVPDVEWDFWMTDANMANQSPTVHRYFLNARRIFRDIAPEVRRFRPGAKVAPGIVSVPAFGHTPGHVAFIVSSRNESLLVIGDSVREPWLFVRHPEWQPSYDMDAAAAVATRKRLLDRAAADRLPVHGYHFPFPATGHIARIADGYDFVPALWQPLDGQRA
jgi:glyoxylase-like metal-dependent hydrolase (beta-lactamase superfamily II)